MDGEFLPLHPLTKKPVNIVSQDNSLLSHKPSSHSPIIFQWDMLGDALFTTKVNAMECLNAYVKEYKFDPEERNLCTVIDCVFLVEQPSA
ncbi:hypothetical protein PoB_002139600 [Plakobranchus ocellatus]|uniref:Uncharacterized protein n=1 Tax=Plakobranchus ocellatus TaxID=259542 RepID=A0AAV3ZG51_9GAST|nr:hypothetical protein PoB_002139600 [Plakobranchus ocellatus]